MLRPKLGVLGRATDAKQERDKDGRFASGGGSTANSEKEHFDAATEHYRAMMHHGAQVGVHGEKPGGHMEMVRHQKAMEAHKAAHEAHSNGMTGYRYSGGLAHLTGPAQKASTAAYRLSANTNNAGGPRPV